MTARWLTIHRGEAPLVVSIPHTGTDLAGLEEGFTSPWRARCDTDWHIDRLYDFAADLGATVVHTAISRSVIDVNRDPSGASLYPGQTTTGLCPTETFDGLPLYKTGREPGPAEIRVTGRSMDQSSISSSRGRVTTLSGSWGGVTFTALRAEYISIKPLVAGHACRESPTTHVGRVDEKESMDQPLHRRALRLITAG